MRNGECLDIQRMANKELIKKQKSPVSSFEITAFGLQTESFQMLGHFVQKQYFNKGISKEAQLNILTNKNQ